MESENTTGQDTAQRTIREMTESLNAARNFIKKAQAKQESSNDFDTKDGISLLSIKYHVLLSYIHSLTLLIIQRVAGNSLKLRTPPSQPFSTLERDLRGCDAGDLVDALIQDRLVLEKIHALEKRMKYQIDKYVRLSESAQNNESNAPSAQDPLAFRANPDNLGEKDADASGSDHSDPENGVSSGIYRPPKVAPVPYNEQSRSSSFRRPKAPSALASLQYTDSTAPYVEKSTGLGVNPSLASARARELQRLTEFEEENMTRLVTNKKEARRRRRDEEDIALGGAGVGVRGRQRGGLEDEFRDIFKSVDRGSRKGVTGDAYDELRQRGKRKEMLERSRIRDTAMHDSDTTLEGPRKRGRFETAVKKARRKEQHKKR